MKATAMKQAWGLYRRIMPAGVPMNRLLFARCLRAGWDLARKPSIAMFETYATVLRAELAPPVPVVMEGPRRTQIYDARGRRLANIERRMFA